MTSFINASTSSGVVTTADTSGSLALQTASTTALTLDTSQNATFAGSVKTNTLTSAASTALTLQSAGTTAVTIDTSQNVGIGTTSPSTRMDIYAPSFGGSYRQITLSAPNSAAAKVNYAGIGYNCDQGSAGSEQGSMSFFTYGSGALSERMRIDSSGNLLVRTTTSTNFQDGFSLYSASQNSQLLVGHGNGAASGNYYAAFYYNTNTIGTITQNGTTGVLYNLTSDYRLKSNPVALTGAKDFVMALQPKKWQWWDGSGEGIGFIAHEFMEVAKYSGHGEKDAVDEDGKPVYQSIQPSSSEVMANIVALMQEQQALITAQAETINALTARIVALEAK